MNDDRTEQLWQHVAGLLPDAEAQQLADGLERDADLRTTWQQIQLLHQQLQQLEPEAPSLRFNKEMLERLPIARRGYLGAATWVQWLERGTVAGLLVLLVLLTGVVTVLLRTKGQAVSSPLSTQVARWLDTLSVGINFYWLLLASSTALLFILLADRLLRRWWGGNLYD